MKNIKAKFKSLLLVTCVVLFLSSCGSNGISKDEAIPPPEPATMDSTTEERAIPHSEGHGVRAPSASAPEKDKKNLKKQENDNDDMERTD